MPDPLLLIQCGQIRRAQSRTSRDRGSFGPKRNRRRRPILNVTEKIAGVVISMIEVTAAALAAHPFLRGMPPGQLGPLVAAATDVMFPAGHRIFEDGGYAARFWLIRSGHVSLDMQAPHDGPVTIDTIGMGELLGLSWLAPPYRWSFGAVSAVPVEAFEFDAAAVRQYCASDPVFGYELTRRLIRVLWARLQSTRVRLIARSDGAASPY